MKQNYTESLAKRSHGKWKSALGHTLLIIGMVLVSLGAYAQTMTPPPAGLKMEKKWQSDDPTGRTGNILVEMFVTGESEAQHTPTDIVLVLDVSGSMNDNMTNYVYNARSSQGYQYNSFPGNNSNNPNFYKYKDQYYRVYRADLGSGNRHIYVLYFQVGERYYFLTKNSQGESIITRTAPTTQNTGTTELWKGVLYSRSQTSQTRKIAALKEAVMGFVDNIKTDASTYQVDHRISIVKYAGDEFYGSASNIEEGNDFYGYYDYNYTQVVVKRRNPVSDYDVIDQKVNALSPGGATAADYGMEKAQYVLASIRQGENGEAEFNKRKKVVVLFTDGEPNHQSGFDDDVADDVINYAHQIKHSWTNGGQTYQFNAQVYTIGVFSNETNKIRTYMNRASLNYPAATSMTNTCAQESEEYYFKAESSEGLNEIFKAIAGASGALELPTTTSVQDVVSPNFHLPANASTAGTIKAYAPKCTGYNEETHVFSWAPLSDAGTLQLQDGVVIEGEGGENRLPNSFVTVNETDQQINLQGFDFTEQWCGNIVDGPAGHQTYTPHGRKIVIKIPVIVNEGTWGDGIATNDPEHSYVIVPDPEHPGQNIYYGPFNNLTTNVMGDVWTEVVTSKPQGYDRMNIDTPEELAWFISEVNGRIHYNGNTNNVASNPSLPGRLTADIDMSAHNWVPIGAGYKCNDQNQYVDANGDPAYKINPNTGQPEVDAQGNPITVPTVKLAYEGVFDGNGHVITGLKNNADKWYKMASGQDNQVVVFPGMFSNVKGNGTTTGIVHDVFILDADFRGKQHNPHFVHHGILADTLTGGKIYNCEAAGRLTCNNDALLDANLIYGGLVGLNNGGTIHSSMAMANLTGYTMGGAVGENRDGSFSNSFTNGEYHYIDKSGVPAKLVGGLAAINTGTINNCYVRFERANENLNKAAFGMLIGDPTSEDQTQPTFCYTPEMHTYEHPDVYSVNSEVISINSTVPEIGDMNPYTQPVTKTFVHMFPNDNSTGGTWSEPGVYGEGIFVYENGTSLLDALNSKVASGQANWKRTTAAKYYEEENRKTGDINDDYPVLQLPNYTCLASTNGITIDYARHLTDMLHRHNTGKISENSPTYSKTAHEAINGGTINLFANDDMNQSNDNDGSKADLDASYYNTDADVVVYIDENTSLLQPTGATTSSIEAYTGQTLYAYSERWHLISSSLEDSEFGWDYLDDDEAPSQNSNRWNAWAQEHSYTNEEGNVKPRDPKDPCLWTLNTNKEDKAFFPIDLRAYTYCDFYCFYEPQYHWLNFRRNSLSHWHMDDPDSNIAYNNEEQFKKGKGYLVALKPVYANNQAYPKAYQFIQNRGTLNNGNVTIPVTCTEGIGWTGRQGYNLLGNPYQSYLDFDAFVNGNSAILGNSAYANTYAVYDPASDTWLQYLAGSSAEGTVSDRYINMHQGFFIQTNNKDESAAAIFTNEMRTNQKGNGFRGNENHYPLVNFTLTDDEGNKDIAVLEVSRPENDGAKKIFVSTSKGRLSLRHDNEDFAILFRDMQSGSQPLYFEAKEDGTFTLSWNTANANFSSLTLVDNLTGVKYDMLANDSYTFQGSMSDYRSRFKVVFGAFTDVEENEEVFTDNFAFFDGSDWVVNGQGQLTVTDITGRTVYTSNLTNDQNRVSLNGVANGIYLMRVANGQNVNVQKIIIK